MWEVAVKSFHTVDRRIVDVEHATDEEFQTWIASQGIPVDEEGISEWVFEDRVGVINHALRFGVNLNFAEDNPVSNTSTNEDSSEVFECPTSASEAI